MPGWRDFRCRFLAAALLGAALLAAGGPIPAKEGVNLKNWIDGPVRYLSLKAEVKAFKKLKSEEDRALFIQRFWDRRDPREETLVNEYRQLFWERVNQANTNFIDSSKPGPVSTTPRVATPQSSRRSPCGAFARGSDVRRMDASRREN